MFQFLGFVQIKYIQYSFTFFKQRHLLLLYIISHMYIFSSHYIESIFFFFSTTGKHTGTEMQVRSQPFGLDLQLLF